jgi:hypothetical protein
LKHGNRFIFAKRERKFHTEHCLLLSLPSQDLSKKISTNGHIGVTMLRVYLASPFGFSPEWKPYKEKVKRRLAELGCAVLDPWEGPFRPAIEEANTIEDLSSRISAFKQMAAEIGKKATDADHFVALGSLAAAEKAAQIGDGPKALEHLKSAGAWVWDIGTKIGIGVATAAAKSALGIWHNLHQSSNCWVGRSAIRSGRPGYS